ncbi:MAG: zinc ribbon domain-containing protein [Anaerolineales bacterium]|nr:zinc ribbon domain-containing protein [Anaerolineales bacterium]
MICPNCNKEIPDDKLFCGYCGARLSPSSEIPGIDADTETLDQQPAQSETPPAGASPPDIDMDAVTRIDRADTPTQVMEEAPPPSLQGGTVCPQCGKMNMVDARFCIECGHALEKSKSEKKQTAPEKELRELRRKKERKSTPVKPGVMPGWIVLITGLGTMLGSAAGYLAHKQIVALDLVLFFTVLGFFSSGVICILLRLYGWLTHWWQAAAGTLILTFLWYAMINIGYSLMYFNWELRSMLFEGAIPGVAGLVLGLFLFGRSRQWGKALGLGLSWLATGITGMFILAYILLSGWFPLFRIRARAIHVGSLVAYGLMGILLGAFLVWLLNDSLAAEKEQKKPDTRRLWSSLGLVFLGWALAELVITSLFALTDMHYVWPFAAMGLIGGIFTLIAIRQFTRISLPLMGGTVLLWVVLSMLRVWLGVEWSWHLPPNMSWSLVSFLCMGLSAAGTVVLLNPRKPDWKLAGWLGLFWGAAFALATPVGNYLIEFSRFNFGFSLGDVWFEIWIWLTPLVTTLAMYFSAHTLARRFISSDIQQQAE